MQDLQQLRFDRVENVASAPREIETVAQVQESVEWTDLRPVGTKYFVGRERLNTDLYRFVRAPLEDNQAPRVFFVEGKSGWGKSSVIAHLRSRARNKRNRNTFFVFAVDSRSANTSTFVGMAVSQLLAHAAEAGFIPKPIASSIRVPSWFDLLADENFDDLFSWLRREGRILVLVFDQFEDVFRKTELFRAFHKLMMDVTARAQNLILGFSWKSEISIPMDNPAYGLWQQAREHAVAFSIDRFGSAEVEKVILQLQQQSGQPIPQPLRRRLREGSQGFPWLTKKLATHCYHELRKGLSPDDLIDQELNVQDLFDRDRDSLNPDEARALKLIAQRGYDGDPFDVSEVDERVAEPVVNRLLAKRLIVRTGGKYTVYWDIFRDYIVEGTPPRLEESFLLRQYPGPCAEALNVLLSKRARGRVQDVQLTLGVSEGTALNHLRELRNVGAVSKRLDRYVVRDDVRSEEDFRAFMKKRLEKHIVVRLLRAQGGDILPADVIAALKRGYSSFTFAQKTWAAYAEFFVAWARYCGLSILARLSSAPARRGQGEAFYTPQLRPEKLLEFLRSLPQNEFRFRRSKERSKQLYDLKSLGVLLYTPTEVVLTPLGRRVVAARPKAMARMIATAAVAKPKIAVAVSAEAESSKDPNVSFEDGVRSLLEDIDSSSYRNVTRHILRAWARFILEHGTFDPTSGSAVQHVAAA
ncbi:ATP-binding protein [Sorangium sp. So ce834]|uniref:ATP-binding protein n=1 Tax=Sorangium sp. So ce834 TaxID=3133321 RepID=UPI003F62B003